MRGRRMLSTVARRRVEAAELAQQPRRSLRVNTHRLAGAARGEIGAIRLPPLRFALRSGPKRVSAEAQFVAARHRRAETVELDLDRLVGARHHAERFEFALRWIGFAHGDRPGAVESRDVRFIADERKGRALRAAIE